MLTGDKWSLTLTVEKETLSREFDAMLRLIAEDLCQQRSAQVDLYDHRHELKQNREAVIASLHSHITACNPDYRVAAIETIRADGLWSSGIPFAVVNKKTGEERWMQVGGCSQGITTCDRASDGEVEKRRAAAHEEQREQQQVLQASSELSAFVSMLQSKVLAAATKKTLSHQQWAAFTHHVRNFEEKGKPVPRFSTLNALEGVSRACVVLGIKLEELITG